MIATVDFGGRRSIVQLTATACLAAAALVAVTRPASAVAGAGLFALVSIVATSRVPLAAGVAFALVLPCMTPPGFIPLSVEVAGAELLVADLVLPIVLAVVLLTPAAVGSLLLPATSRRALFVYAAVASVAVVYGAAHSAPLAFLWRDARGPVYLVIAAALVCVPYRGGALLDSYLRRLVGATVITGLVMVLANLSLGLPLPGRVEDVVNFRANSNITYEGATRFLVPSTHLALVTASVLMVAALFRRLSRSEAVVLAASLALCALSFSRNSVVVLAVSLLVGLAVRTVAPRTAVSLNDRVPRLLAGLVVFVLAVVLSPLGAVVGQQSAAYAGRVLDGFSDEQRRVDTSLAIRTIENDYGWDAFSASPLVGTGMGRDYRPLVGSERTPEQTYYIHNAYMWHLVKGGIVGGIAIFALLGRTLWVGLRQSWRERASGNRPMIPYMATLIGLLPVLAFVPLTADATSATVIGGLLGLMLRETTSGLGPRDDG